MWTGRAAGVLARSYRQHVKVTRTAAMQSGKRGNLKLTTHKKTEATQESRGGSQNISGRTKAHLSREAHDSSRKVTEGRRARKWGAFMSNPFGLVEQILGEKLSGQLSYFKNGRQLVPRKPLGMANWRTSCLALRRPSMIQSKGDPGGSQRSMDSFCCRNQLCFIHFTLSKTFLWLFGELWKGLVVIWRGARVWMYELQRRSCTISQLSMEGKVSFSILSQCQRPCQYLLQNEYMDAARLCLVWVRKFKHVWKDGGHKAARGIERVGICRAI